MTNKHALLLMLVAFAGLLSAVEATPPAPAKCVQLELFVKSNEEASTKARAFSEKLRESRAGLRILIQDTDKDDAARVRLEQLTKRLGFASTEYPSFYVYDQLVRGFQDEKISAEQIEALLTIHVYVRTGCGHCRDAKAFLSELQPRYPAFKFQYHDILTEKGASDKAEALTRKYAVRAVGFPVIHLLGRLEVGFINADISGRRLEALLNQAVGDCGIMPEKKPLLLPINPGSDKPGARLLSPLPFSLAVIGHSLPPIHLNVGRQEFRGDSHRPIGAERLQSALPALDSQNEPNEREDGMDVPVFGRLCVKDLGMPLFTFMIGLIDGFNPCAMWVLIFLLSLLATLHDRRKMAAIAGTFVAVSGLAYMAFMAAWLNVFMLIGFARPAQVALGILGFTIGAINVKDFFAFKKGVSLSIPEAAKPTFYSRVRSIVAAKYLWPALVGATVLAVLVNTIELLCTAGLPAMYTEILTQRHFPAWKNYSYLLLYIIAYMFDDTIMVIIGVVTLSHKRLQQNEGRWLKMISGAVMLLLGITMIFKPSWLF